MRREDSARRRPCSSKLDAVVRFAGRPQTKQRLCAALVLVLAMACAARAQESAGSVSVYDHGSQIAPVTFECTPGHKAETHLITLDSGAARYTFRYSGCVDPSHGDLRPSSEGNFGMPDPTPANWYWGGFLQVFVNGTDAIKYRQTDMRVIESGARGGLQAIWAHPDADVGLRLLLLPGANHVLAYLTWKPRPPATVNSIAVHLRCYPSFFTAARGRQGERHCKTPRIDKGEPETLELVPSEDTWLLFYDAIFDKAKGEGEGPCAALVVPDAVQSGKVIIGDYAVITQIALKPEAGAARLAFYDFAGLTNAQAEEYMKTHGAEDLRQLVETDFRPEPVRLLQLDRLKADVGELLAQAAEDAAPLRPKVDDLLARAAALGAQADSGDWKAEADLATLLQDSVDLLWKLRAFAVLNAP